MAQMKSYGLEVKGHFWKDDLPKAAWMAAREDLIDPQISLWAILASDEQLMAADTLYGLSLLTIAVQAKRGLNFPIMLFQTQGTLVSVDQLSTPLKGLEVISVSDSGFGAKVVAKVHGSPRAVSSEYHQDIYCSEQIGQWFEVRPTSSSWPGVMFGVAGAQIAFHAIGPSGSLPSKSVLNFPMQGLKLQLGETEYLAWATQNELNAETSYFVKVEEYPRSIIFGPYSPEETADVFVVKLK
jgi:hypothetical protein